MYTELVELIYLRVPNLDIAVLTAPLLLADVSINDLLPRALLAAAPFTIVAVLLLREHREFSEAELAVLLVLFWTLIFLR